MIYGIAHRTHAGSHIGLGRADSLAFRSCRPAGRPAGVAVVVVVVVWVMLGMPRPTDEHSYTVTVRRNVSRE